MFSLPCCNFVLLLLLAAPVNSGWLIQCQPRLSLGVLRYLQLFDLNILSVALSCYNHPAVDSYPIAVYCLALLIAQRQRPSSWDFRAQRWRHIVWARHYWWQRFPRSSETTGAWSLIQNVNVESKSRMCNVVLVYSRERKSSLVFIESLTVKLADCV